MECNRFWCMSILIMILLDVFLEVKCQKNLAFELPVQLVGFPFIIMSVKFTNFLKKLQYSVSPATYRSRNRRELTFLDDSQSFDVQEVEKRLVEEFGARVCVFERICSHYAAKTSISRSQGQIQWDEVFSQYKRSDDQAKEFYLLSVFLGDIVGSPQLCRQLGKRRSCDDTMLIGKPEAFD